MATNILLSVVLSGLMLGGVYALVSSGLNMIYGVMKVINFAQGEFVMLGMFVTYWLNLLYGVDPFVSLLVTAPLGFAVGVAVQRLIINRTLGHSLFVQTVATFGLLLILQNSAQLVWGPQFRTVETPFSTTSLDILGGTVGLPVTIAFVASVIAILGFYLMLTKTRIGLALRATSENPEAASLLGIRVPTMNDLSFGFGGLLGFISGTFLATYFYIYPAVGSIYILRAFIIVVLGGMGNILGALAGGLVIGEAEVVGGFAFGNQWSGFISMVVFIIVLLVRPTGIFGTKLK